ncbi:hypothetical protein LNO89_00815 [Klebsiella pneumoniae subsp. pneumoniae]|nr:hypothetical protein [Klebsiella pneumoniae subsp. pneumoniae]
MECAGGVFYPALPGGTLPPLKAGGPSHARLPVARTRRSRRLRVIFSAPVPAFMPDGGYALSGLQGPLKGSYLPGPRKRSAAGQDIRHGTCNFAGWRLSPCPAYRVVSQARWRCADRA